jgi:hypothetical protein
VSSIQGIWPNGWCAIQSASLRTVNSADSSLKSGSQQSVPILIWPARRDNFWR